MKLFYKSYAPDVSAGSTTIKDVGKKRSPRKLITLWSFLMALLMMVPVGAMAAGDGTIDNPWTGDIEDKSFNIPNGSVYLKDVTGGQLHIQADGVTIYVAGNNVLTADNSNSGHPALELGDLGSTEARKLTIKYWDPDGNQSLAALTLEAKGESANIAGTTAFPGVDLHDYETDFVVDGPVMVKAAPGNRGSGVADYAEAFFTSTDSKITLSNGAYFTYSNSYKASQVPNATNWTITNFASVGDAAATLLASKQSITVNGGNLNADLKTFTNSVGTFYQAKIGEQTFYAPQSGSSFKLLVGDGLKDYYGELVTQTENVAYPFPIHSENAAAAIPSTVNVGVAQAGGSYVGQLDGQTQGDFTLNVGTYSHGGTLSASAGDITLAGTQNYKTLNTTKEGLTLNTENNHTLTLNNITIPAGNKVLVNGDVRLGTGSSRCFIENDVIKFKKSDSSEESVYFCQISYVDTDLEAASAADAIEVVGNKAGYPSVIDLAGNQILMWLPVGSHPDIKFQLKNTANAKQYSMQRAVGTTHAQTITLAPPTIYIENTAYETLSEAFEAVKNGETIRLEGNYTARNGGNAIGTNIQKGESFTLDLKDYTLDIGGQVADDGRYPLISTKYGTLIITAGQGKIIGNYRVAGRETAADKDLEGCVYTIMANPGNPHVGGTPVTPKVVGTRVTVSTDEQTLDGKPKLAEMPSAIHYTIDDRTVYAAKEVGTNTKVDETKYCLWLPNDNNTYLVKGQREKVFAQINNSTNKDNVALKPLFNLNSGSIKVTQNGILYANGYKYAGSTEDGNADLGKYASTPVVVTTYVSKEPSYNESYTLTVEDGTYVMVKDIYRNELLETNGEGANGKVTTKLVAKGNANVIMSGINSLGDIEIAENSNLTIDRLDENPPQANTLRFFTITGANKDNSILTMNGGALLSYITDTDISSVAMNTISNVKAVYKDGSVRAKFDDKDTRFENEKGEKLYRLTFSTLDGYTPYTVEYKDMNSTEEGATVRVPLTSDKNGEVHLWLPADYDGTSVSFFSANSSKTIAHPKIEENDENKAPIAVRVFRGDGTSADSEVGTFRSLARAFAAINAGASDAAQQYTIELLMPHTESNANCVVPGKKVTLKLNGYNLVCSKVNFDTNTNENAFLMITNDVATDKHSSIEGEISITPNVYISRTVHMTNIHVTNQDHKTVYRTLVTGLEHGKTYRYFYNGLQRDFKVENQVTDGDKTLDVACLWPYASQIPQELLVYPLNGNEIDKNGALTVPGGELAITSHFDNYLALVKVENVAKVGNTYYRKFSDAIKAANDGGGDIQLLTNIQSQATFEITNNYAINLDKYNLSFTQGGFDVNNNKLTISGGKSSTLTGVITLKGDVAVNESVLIGGVVLQQSTDAIKTVYRLLVDKNGTTQCVWTETPERDTDKELGNDHEYTIPAGLANHQTKVKAYPVVTLNTADATWNDDYEDCNIVLNSNAVWNVSSGKKNIHRLTIHEGAKVVTDTGTKITATDGIRYIRTFKDNAWSMIALPYTATDVTTVIDDKVVSLSPASNPGTSGHFWLQSIQADGSTTDVTDSEMTANKVYVMKVPASLATKEITFVSGSNQMLRRDKVLNPNPVSGFVAYANGTLNDVTLDKPFYQLNDAGDTFKRVDDLTTPIAPFSGYLLADAATTAKVANFSLRSSVATDNEEIIVPEESLLVRAEKGRILLTAEQPMQVVICDMAGVVKFSGEIPAGNSSFEVGAGIHVVNNQKVIVW